MVIMNFEDISEITKTQSTSTLQPTEASSTAAPAGMSHSAPMNRWKRVRSKFGKEQYFFLRTLRTNSKTLFLLHYAIRFHRICSEWALYIVREPY